MNDDSNKGMADRALSQDQAIVPAPEDGCMAGGVHPVDEMEAYLVKLWGELLPVEQISTTDDFYVLGGHSLLVAKMHFAIKRDWGIEMDFEQMLGTSVLSELAQIITRMRRNIL